MTIIATTLSVLLMVSFAGTGDAAETALTGAVLEKGTGIPVSDAKVTFISEASDTVRTTTDIAGKYFVLLDETMTIVDNATHPGAVMLRQNYPNPFNPTTVIEYYLSSPGSAYLSVYNIMGQQVRMLAEGNHTAGLHHIVWDGCDESSNKVSAGMYFYCLTANATTETKKMILLDGGNRDTVHRSLYPAAKAVSENTPVLRNFKVLAVKDGHPDFQGSLTISSDQRLYEYDIEMEASPKPIVVKPTWLRSYRSGGGIFFISLRDRLGIHDNMEISVLAAPELNAELDRNVLTATQPLAELTIHPDSTVQFNSHEGRVQLAKYEIQVIGAHAGKSYTLTAEVQVIKDVSIPNIDPHLKPVDFIERVNALYPDIPLSKDMSWQCYFASDGQPYGTLQDVYPEATGAGATFFISPVWHIVSYHELYPPFPTWRLLRRRGNINPVYLERSDYSTGLTYEISVEEFPFRAFWWEYFDEKVIELNSYRLVNTDRICVFNRHYEQIMC